MDSQTVADAIIRTGEEMYRKGQEEMRERCARLIDDSAVEEREMLARSLRALELCR